MQYAKAGDFYFPLSNNTMTVQNLKSTFITSLAPLYDASEAAAIFALCTEYVLHTSPHDPYTVITEDQFIQLQQLLSELQKGIPVQYVTGQAYFWDTFYKVSPATLIPRPETEELLFWIQQDSYTLPRQNIRILDIGTGSGCIAITAKKIFPEAEVAALDISPEALEITAYNARTQHLVITTIQHNILDCKEEFSGHQKWDMIISNPPYITTEERVAMHTNVLQHEPHQALFVTNNDPQQFYRAIGTYAQQHLSTGGTVYLELNALFALQTAALFKEMGFHTQLRKDMQGKDRMLKAWRC